MKLDCDNPTSRSSSGPGFPNLDRRSRSRNRESATSRRCVTPHGRQRMGIAGEQPAAVGLFAIDSDSVAGQLRCFSAGSRFHGQRVPTTCVGDLAEDGDLHNLAHAMNPRALVTDQEAVWEFTPAKVSNRARSPPLTASIQEECTSRIAPSSVPKNLIVCRVARQPFSTNDPYDAIPGFLPGPGKNQKADSSFTCVGSSICGLVRCHKPRREFIGRVHAASIHPFRVRQNHRPDLPRLCRSFHLRITHKRDCLV